MTKWNNALEDDLIALIKDWLKHKGRTQADLSKSINASSTRMSSILEILKKDFFAGGLPKVASHLCDIEEAWSTEQSKIVGSPQDSTDPFGQLDLLLEDIKENCEN